MRKNRKQLPPVARLKKRVDVGSLLKEMITAQLLDVSAFTDFRYDGDSPLRTLLDRNVAVRKLAGSAGEDGYRQRSLTRLSRGVVGLPPVVSGDSPKARLARLDRGALAYDPLADERNYGELLEVVGPELRSVVDDMGGHLCRVRLAALLPGAAIQPHRDYDPTYLVRYHLPLLTNKESRIFVEVDGHIRQFHFQNDGSIYFLNTGLRHWVRNSGDTVRIHLLVDIDGQGQLVDMERVEPLDLD